MQEVSPFMMSNGGEDVKVIVLCEKCKSAVELTPQTYGQHASLRDIEDNFRVSEITLDYDHSVEEIDDVTATVDDIRIDCKNCGDYIVLKDFPSYVYR